MSDYICFELQQEIIKRLPVKSLIRFRAVCKAWKSLIDSSEFIAGYNAPHTQPQHLLIKYETGDDVESEVKCVCFVDDETFPQQKFDPIIPWILEELHLSKIIDSSHGLLCLYGSYHRQLDWLNVVTKMALLWNPSIRKSIGVVVPNVLRPYSNVLGFGVCPTTGDPMLVRIVYIDRWLNSKKLGGIPKQVMLFTLSSGEWTNLCDNLPRESLVFTWSSTVIGQFIYWLAYDRSDEDERVRFRNLLVSFDMDTEEFNEIDLPDSLQTQLDSSLFHNDTEEFDEIDLPDSLQAQVGSSLFHNPELAYSISRLRESLVVIECTKNTITELQVCGVWMMEDGDPKSFTKLFNIIAVDAMITRTLGFSKSTGEPIIEKQDHFVGDFYVPPTFGVYELCSEHIKDLEISAAENSVFVNSYTESLLLLDEEDDSIYTI